MQPDAVADRVLSAYGIRLVSLVEAEEGADVGAMSWRGETAGDGAYAVKLAVRRFRSLVTPTGIVSLAHAALDKLD